MINYKGKRFFGVATPRTFSRSGKVDDEHAYFTIYPVKNAPIEAIEHFKSLTNDNIDDWMEKACNLGLDAYFVEVQLINIAPTY